MAMIDLGALRVGVTVDTSTATQSLNKFDNELKKSGSKAAVQWDKVGSALNKFGANMTKYVTAPIAGAMVAAVKLASDMQETMSKVNVVFGDNAQEVIDWGDTTIDTIGLAKQTALDMAAGFQDMGTSMGIGSDKSADMSMKLVQLAGDMASFKNISIERAQTALNAVYTGETESLKALGIVMTEANLKAFAMNQGITKQYEELTQAEKVQLRYAYVMAQTTNAQGDFERTSDSAANQSRAFKERLKELGAQFGEKLLPVVESVLGKVNGLLDAFMNSSDSTQSAILWGIGIAAAIGPVVGTVGNIITAVDKMKTAFAAGTLSLATLGWIAGALALAAGIAAIALTVKNHYDKIYEDANNLNSAMSDFSSEMQTISTTYQDSMDNIEITSGLAEDYVKQLENLEEAGLKTKDSQEQYASVVRQLKTLIPGLNIEIDKQTGKIKGGASAVRNATEAWKAQAIQQAMLTKQTAQVDALATAIQALTDAEVAAGMNSKELALIREKQLSVEEKLATATGKTADELKSMTAGDLLFFFASLGEEAQKLGEEWLDLDSKAGDLTTGQTALNASIVTAKDSVAAATAEVDKTTAAYEKAYGVISNTDAVTEGTDAVVDGLEGVGTAADNAAKDIRDFSSDVSDMTKNLKDEADVTMKEALKNLEANTKLYDSLWVNIGSLMKRGVSQDFLFHLQQMGPSGWKIIDDMNKSTDKQLQQFVDAWDKNGESAKQTWETEIGEIPKTTKDAVEDAVDEAKTGGSNVGGAMGDGIEGGISGAVSKIAAQAKRAVQAAIAAAKREAEIASPSKKMKRLIGKPLAEGIAVGFEEETDNVVTKVKSSVSNIIIGGSAVAENAAKQASIKQQDRMYGNVTNTKTATVTQHNTFTAKVLTPYEQQVELRKLDKDLARSFA